MTDERVWIPVEVLWDEGRRQQERSVADRWRDEFDEAELERWLTNAHDEDAGAQLTRRKRKRQRGEQRPGDFRP